jgi:hypothetical protein
MEDEAGLPLPHVRCLTKEQAAAYLGIKAKRSWQEAVVRYLAVKSHLRDIEKQRDLPQARPVPGGADG